MEKHFFFFLLMNTANCNISAESNDLHVGIIINDLKNRYFALLVNRSCSPEYFTADEEKKKTEKMWSQR